MPVAAVVALATIGLANVEENPFGPDHIYIPPVEVVDDDKFKLAPAVIGLLLPTVAITAGEQVGAGAFTTTFIVETSPVHVVPTSYLTEYVPVAAVVALATIGLAKVEANPFGPDHTYIPPVVFVDDERFKALPAVIGLLLPTVAITAGEQVGEGVEVGITERLVVPKSEMQPLD